MPPSPSQDAAALPVELPEGSAKRREWPFGGASCIGQYSMHGTPAVVRKAVRDV